MSGGVDYSGGICLLCLAAGETSLLKGFILLCDISHKKLLGNPAQNLQLRLSLNPWDKRFQSINNIPNYTAVLPSTYMK